MEKENLRFLIQVFCWHESLSLEKLAGLILDFDCIYRFKTSKVCLDSAFTRDNRALIGDKLKDEVNQLIQEKKLLALKDSCTYSTRFRGKELIESLKHSDSDFQDSVDVVVDIFIKREL